MAEIPITETLRKWLVQDGHAEAAQQATITVPDDKWGRFRSEADERHPEYGYEQRDAWAVMCYVGMRHMSKAEQQDVGAASTGIERIARATEVQAIEWSKLREGFAGLTAGLMAVEAAEMNVGLDLKKSMLEANEGVAAKLSDINKTMVLEGCNTRRAMQFLAETWEVRHKKREKWLWAWRFVIMLGLFLLTGLLAWGQEQNPYRLAAYRTARLYAMPQQPHDPIIIRFKNEGTTISTKIAGILNIDCVGAGVNCTYASNTVTMTIGGGGGGGYTPTVNGAALASTTAFDLDDATPAAAANGLNVLWQKDALDPTNISAYILQTAITKLGTIATGVWNGTVVDPVYGGTGANNTPTSGRYLRADGTDFLTSSVAAGGAGTCTNQFVRATVDNAAPTCATVAKTDANASFAHEDEANTWTTGAQSFAAATSLLVPTSAAYAPTADGSIGYDSTQDKYVAGGAGAVNGSFPRILFVGNATTDGNANTEAPTGNKITDDTSTTSEVDYALSYTLPANYLIANKAVRFTWSIEYITGAGSPNLTFRVRWAGLTGTILYSQATVQAPTSSVTRSHFVSLILIGTAAAGASVNVETLSLQFGNWASNTMGNSTAQPVAVATNASAEIVLTGQWSSNAANTHTMRVRALIVEEIN